MVSEIVHRVGDALVVDMDGDAAVLRPETGDLLVLNATAAAIWNLCGAPISVESVVSTLAQSYGPAESLRADVLRTIELFRRAGFLHVEVDGTAAEPAV